MRGRWPHSRGDEGRFDRPWWIAQPSRRCGEALVARIMVGSAGHGGWRGHEVRDEDGGLVKEELGKRLGIRFSLRVIMRCLYREVI